MGWEPLAASDPVPGDPWALRATAEHLELLGEASSAQAGRVKRIDPGECWVGLAAQRFGDHRDEVPPALESAATRCFDTAAALKRYAPRLEEAQELAAEALRRARAASADMAEADRGVDAMARHDTAARRHAEEWNAARPDAPPHPPDPWSGPDWPALLAGAEADLEAARRLLDEALEIRNRAATTAVGDIEAARADDLVDPWFTAGASWIQALFGWVWSRPGPVEVSFVVTDAGLVLNTVESWQHQALCSAGVDPAAWDPARGLAANDAPVQAAWELYARLYADNPDQFLWAGMAKLAGATFYAGFQDLHVLRRAIEDGTMTAGQVEEALEKLYPGLPDPVVHRLVDLGADDLGALAGQLRYVETTFLRMQRNIFDDLAWQHVAYQEGRMEALSALHATRAIKTSTFEPGATSTRVTPLGCSRAIWGCCTTSRESSLAGTTTPSATAAGPLAVDSRHVGGRREPHPRRSPVPGGGALRDRAEYARPHPRRARPPRPRPDPVHRRAHPRRRGRPCGHPGPHRRRPASQQRVDLRETLEVDPGRHVPGLGQVGGLRSRRRPGGHPHRRPGRRATYHPRLVVALRARRMRRHLGVALLLAVLVAGCTVTFEEGEQADQRKEAPVKPVWDLRNSHRIEDVGWPEDNDLDLYHVVAEPGELTILLPADVVIEPPPEGALTVIPSRPPDFAEGADHGRLESIVVNYPDEPVPAAARRAAALAGQWGIDASRLAEWAARNADGVDLSAGGSMATTGSQRPTEGGPSLSIDARALSAGESYLSVTVSWYDESQET